MRTIFFGKVGGLTISAKPNMLIGAALLWLILAAVGFWVLELSPLEAILGGVGGAILQLLAEYLHQIGHARAARRSGYPMIGIRFWWVLATSIYPRDEGDLAPAIHIRRALGGPQFSLGVAVIAGALAWFLHDANPVLFYLILYFALVNLLVMTIGALLPLGFTDGSTLLRYWPRRHEPR
jgi:hypothetical protein